MPGELDLATLLSSMTPMLRNGEFVFCTVPPAQVMQLQLDPICQFLEDEGVTLIVSREDADRCGLPYDYVARMVTLSVHSSLSAVGFLAAIATHLANAGISVNPVSAYYHDHLFIPSDRAEDTMAILNRLSSPVSDV
ncbi:MAG: ACT domain-containing protein [Cyanobacteria bacterium P01_E01_bin.6]